MRYNVFVRKLKSSLLLFVASIVLVSTLVSSITAVYSASAWGADNPPEEGWDTAKAKLTFLALDYCIGEANNNDSTKRVRDDVVKDSGQGLNIESWDNDKYKSFWMGDWIEDDHDSIWSCQDFGKRFGVLSRVGIDYMQDLFCSFDQNVTGSSYGFITPEDGKDCYTFIQQIVNDGEKGHMKRDSDLFDYLDKLFVYKVFGGEENIPGWYSACHDQPSACLSNFTELEKYYMYLEGFKTRCAIDRNKYSLTSVDGVPGIAEVNANGEIEIRYYSINSGAKDVNFYRNRSRSDGKVRDSLGDISCSTLVSYLSPRGEPVVNGLVPSLGKECKETYAEYVSEVKNWWAENGSKYSEDTQNAVNYFLASYSENKDKPWSYDGSGPTFTCEANDFAEKWEKLKGELGLGGPEFDGAWHKSNESTGTATTGSVEANCHSASGSIGWILCPVLEFAADAADWAYRDVVEPSLHTDPELFQTDGDYNGTYQAWQIFRDIANIIFVIIFLIVIFSQLTGHGIDNYGIKKTLPKLILAAILVNISFIICQGVVDLSNIAGSGIYDGLINIANGIRIEGGAALLNNTGSVAIGVISLIAVGVAGTMIGGMAFWAAIGSILLAFVPVLLSAVAAILFLFVLLALRQAIVVVLVAIAPLAFVAYVLPNTKNLFDKWSKILRGMLLVYPISALLIAGGRLASRVIFAAGGGKDLRTLLIAMAAEIAPLFFIPTVVRSAYRVTGQLGARLNGIGAKLTHGVRARTQDSNTMRYLNQKNQTARANQTINKFRQRYQNGNNLPTTAAGRFVHGVRNMKYQQAQGVAAAATKQYSTIYSEADKAAVENELKDALAKLDPQRFVAAFRDLLQKGGKEETLKALYNNPAVMNNPVMRASIEREMGGSGLSFMKEYAKYRGSGGTEDFRGFIDNGHLFNQLNAKGETAMANLDKDEYAFLSGVNSAAFRDRMGNARINEALWARAATSLTSSDQAVKFNTLVQKAGLTDFEQQAIADKISIASSATMFDSTRIALSSAVPGKANDVDRVKDRFNNQFTALRTKPSDYAGVIAQMREDDKNNYI